MSYLAIGHPNSTEQTANFPVALSAIRVIGKKQEGPESCSPSLHRLQVCPESRVIRGSGPVALDWRK